MIFNNGRVIYFMTDLQVNGLEIEIVEEIKYWSYYKIRYEMVLKL